MKAVKCIFQQFGSNINIQDSLRRCETVADKIKVQQAHLGVGKARIIDFCEDTSRGQSSNA
jgi:hypothetical protein